jgi:hypothetical protein
MRPTLRGGILLALIATTAAFSANAAVGTLAPKGDVQPAQPPASFEQADTFAVPALPADSMEAAQSLRGTAFEPAPVRMRVPDGASIPSQPGPTFRPAAAERGSSTPKVPTRGRAQQRR